MKVAIFGLTAAYILIIGRFFRADKQNLPGNFILDDTG